MAFVGNPSAFSFYLTYILLGFLAFLFFSALVGGLLGLIFAALIDRLPLRSTYSKALVFCVFLWVIVCVLLPIRLSSYSDLVLFIAFVIETAIFGVALPIRLSVFFDIMVFIVFVIESLCFVRVYSKWA
jgi:hypothetical protein